MTVIQIHCCEDGEIAAVNYNFEWEPTKASRNQRKHSISFEHAATIFRDPNQLSIYDESHSDDEDRWITIGTDNTGNIIIVIHTYREIDNNEVSIRLISARKATAGEERQYYEAFEHKL